MVRQLTEAYLEHEDVRDDIEYVDSGFDTVQQLLSGKSTLRAAYLATWSTLATRGTISIPSRSMIRSGLTATSS